MEDAIKKSEILIEALPYIKKFQGKVIVIKYGGSALVNRKKRLKVLEDIIFMRLAGMRPVIVHGGAPFINEKYHKSSLKPKFIDGLRVTGGKEMKLIQDTLTLVNRRITEEIKTQGGKAQRVQGQQVIRAKRHRRFKELGYVGEVCGIDSDRLEDICSREIIPVISPLGRGRDKHVYNINGDQAAAHIARALSAEKLALLTNVEGIYGRKDNKKSFISSLSRSRARLLIGKGIIASGMIPKVKACILAINGGVKKAHIIDGSLSHALLLEIFTDKGIGTEVVR